MHRAGLGPLVRPSPTATVVLVPQPPQPPVHRRAAARTRITKPAEVLIALEPCFGLSSSPHLLPPGRRTPPLEFRCSSTVASPLVWSA
jgi:hypothetical protein